MILFIFYLDNVAMRGERLELLVNKTENLSNNVWVILCLLHVANSIHIFRL